MSATIHHLFSPARAAAACEFDADLIRRLDRNGPRYTSYPTADRFTDAYTAADYRKALAARAADHRVRPLSLYAHVPFCESLCYYCGCNKIITRDRAKAERYLGYLGREIDLQGRLLRGSVRVEQLHLGGGTPTFLTVRQIEALVGSLRARLEFAPVVEASIEIDPRTVDAAAVAGLAAIGFNRMSLGVQDFDPEVQRRINRVQSEEQTAAVMQAGRAHGFRSINVDLIYGLPKQTTTSVARTLERVIALAPDRIAFYNYAHLPALFKSQRLIAQADLPAADAKLQMLGDTIRRLRAAGYVHIGMDHFALPDDELAAAQRRGHLQRNFQGYSTHAEHDLLGLGASAIGMVGTNYYQNCRPLKDYYARLDANELPVLRGYAMSADDALRRAVIQALMCQFEVCKDTIRDVWLIDFDAYFAAEAKELDTFEAEGLIERDASWISVTPRGRLLIRSICMVFDRYLRADAERRRYSKVI
ncbi:MAG: oxygen-independent coproporphyrinogen III oxidase [Burkholderiales bacterium]|nr:oxygen-independent coproporphyrinogen III oxidase [Burkholderiales bacterium]